jgi:hypothetical protein
MVGGPRAKVGDGLDRVLRGFWGGKVCVFDSTPRIDRQRSTAEWHHVDSDRTRTTFSNVVPLSAAKNQEIKLLLQDPGLESSQSLSYHEIHAAALRHRLEGNLIGAYGCYKVGAHVHRVDIRKRLEFALAALEALIHAPSVFVAQRGRGQLAHPGWTFGAAANATWVHLSASVLEEEVLGAIQDRRFSRLRVDERRRFLFKMCLDISDHFKLSGDLESALVWCKYAASVGSSNIDDKAQRARWHYHVAEIHGALWNVCALEDRSRVVTFAKQRLRQAARAMRSLSEGLRVYGRPPSALQYCALLLTDGRRAAHQKARRALSIARAHSVRNRTAKDVGQLLELGVSHTAACDLHHALVLLHKPNYHGKLWRFFMQATPDDARAAFPGISDLGRSARDDFEAAMAQARTGYEAFLRAGLHGVWAGPLVPSLVRQFEEVFIHPALRVPWRCPCPRQIAAFSAAAKKLVPWVEKSRRWAGAANGRGFSELPRLQPIPAQACPTCGPRSPRPTRRIPLA